MTALLRANIEFCKKVFIDRLGDPYLYGAEYDPFNLKTGADCSGADGIFIGAAISGATAMSWGRQFSTETFPGPFQGFRQTTQADLVSGSYPIKVCIMHGGGGPDSHMNCSVDGWVMESNGTAGTCTTGTGAIPQDSTYWNDWWVYDATITEDGTPRQVLPVTAPASVDTLFADVSQYQIPVDDTYPYKVLSIRVCDGSENQDTNFAQNYAWMRGALDSGQLTFGILYTYVRPSEWAANGQTMMAMIDGNGGLHPRCALMLDVESGDGNGTSDQSTAINNLYALLGQYAGSDSRVIGYGNVGDLDSCWATKPPGIALIVAAYGSNPDYPGKIAHQYTDGTGYGAADGIPDGCSPFGNCDMNSADGLDPDAFALACGIGATQPATPPATGPVYAVAKPQDPTSQTSLIFDQLLIRWPILNNYTPVEALAVIGQKLGLEGFGL